MFSALASASKTSKRTMIDVANIKMFSSLKAVQKKTAKVGKASTLGKVILKLVFSAGFKGN